MALDLRGALTLAWRNLWRNHRRTLIMLAAISIGVWAMIFMTALMRGMVDNMIKDGIQNLPGHVQVHHIDYLDDPSVVNSFAMPSPDFQAVLDSPLILRWSMRVKVPAVIASERDSRGIILLGVDAGKERTFGLTEGDIIAGDFLPSTAQNGIVIGQQLADKLDTRLGKRIVIMSQDPENNLAERGFIITGIYQSSIPGFAEMYVYADRSYIQALLNIPNQISEIAILGDDYRDITELTDYITARAPADLQVLNWLQLDSYLASMLNVMDGFALIWIIVIFLALSFGLINTLMMAVFERIREIGLMQALGMRASAVLLILLLESLLLLLFGLLLGNLAGVVSLFVIQDGIDISALAEGMAMMGASAVLYPKFMLADLLFANAIVIALGLLTCLYPAWRAARVDPIIALNKH